MSDTFRSSLALLYNISRDLATSVDLKTILSRVLFLSTKNVGAERGSLVVLDDDCSPIEAAIIYQDKLMPHTLEQVAGILTQGLAGWVMWNREAALLPDTSQDVRWMLRPDDAVDRSGAKSAICVPLSMRDKLVGILTIVHPEPGFLNGDHLDLLQAIADQAGIAIYNALLYESLQSAQRRYRELFEGSIDPIIITDFSGNIIEVNRQSACIIGISSQDLLGRSIFDLHKADLGDLHRHNELLEEGSTVSYQSELVSSSHLVIPLEVHVRKINIESDDYLQWILRDISERKEVETIRQDLIAMVYHDVRSPLSNIVTSMEMVETMVPQDDPTLGIVLSVINRSLGRVQRLINSLLDINKLEDGKPITKQSQGNISDLVGDVIEIVSPALLNKEQNISVRLKDDIPDLWIDEDMIRRVFVNLLENATKYSPQGGALTIGGQDKGEFVHLWVEDSGPGIPVASRDIIFDKYSRLDLEKFPKGIGLGLAFCRLAVEAHGGKIWVEDAKSDSSGSRFVFSLPAVH